MAGKKMASKGFFALNNAGIRFPWPWAPDDLDGGIDIRILNGAQMERLNDETVTDRSVVIDGQLYKDPVIDLKKREQLRIEMSIVGWDKFPDPEKPGEFIPCTAEAKVRLMRESVDFATFVKSCLDRARELTEERTRLAEKN